jgi:hypothetical protein
MKDAGRKAVAIERENSQRIDELNDAIGELNTAWR